MTAQTEIEPVIVSALAKALPELESAKKNKANPAFKSKYADLAAVIDALEPLRAHGLWYCQKLHENADGVMVETIYLHVSGETLSAGTLFMPATKRDAQGYGSALSYARRYALQTAFGLATEDDDGNAATKSAPAKQEPVSKFAFPAGPATGITQLKALARELWREIDGCGDDSELNALLDTKDAKALMQQMAALEDPNHREIWEGDGKDNPGLAGFISRKQTEFAQYMADLVRT
jgi:hypothetical protein